MNSFSSYDKTIREYISDPNFFIKNYPLSADPSPIQQLILSLKKDFDEFKRQSNSFSEEDLTIKDVNSLFLLEAEINYLSNCYSNQVYSKKENSKKEEFVSVCNQALAIYPNAFLAAKALSWLYEIHEKPKEAYELLTRIWQHGFRTNRIADNLVFISANLKDWENGIIFSAFPQSPIFRFILRLYLLTRRYHFEFIFYVGLLISVIIIKSWLLLLGIIFVICLFLFIMSFRMNSKVLLTMGIIGTSFVVLTGIIKLFFFS